MCAATFVMRQPTFPIRGVDVAGQVEAVGKNVTRLRPGDEAFGTGRGTFAEYTTSREDRLVPKPPELTFAQAAAIGVAGMTALQGLRDRGQGGHRLHSETSCSTSPRTVGSRTSGAC